MCRRGVTTSAVLLTVIVTTQDNHHRLHGWHVHSDGRIKCTTHDMFQDSARQRRRPQPDPCLSRGDSRPATRPHSDVTKTGRAVTSQLAGAAPAQSGPADRPLPCGDSDGAVLALLCRGAPVPSVVSISQKASTGGCEAVRRNRVAPASVRGCCRCCVCPLQCGSETDLLHRPCTLYRWCCRSPRRCRCCCCCCWWYHRSLHPPSPPVVCQHGTLPSTMQRRLCRVPSCSNIDVDADVAPMDRRRPQHRQTNEVSHRRHPSSPTRRSTTGSVARTGCGSMVLGLIWTRSERMPTRHGTYRMGMRHRLQSVPA